MAAAPDRERAGFADALLDFNRMTRIAADGPMALFDSNANGRVGFTDVVRLFSRL